MADRKQLEDALIAAHNAGDTEAAQLFADEINALTSQPIKKTYAASDVPLEAIRNVPTSAGRFVSEVVESAVHPVRTLEGLINLASAGLTKVLPESVIKYAVPEKVEKAKAVGKAVGEFYGDRYGSAEGVKRTLAEDPVGALADVSTILSGGAGLTRLAGAAPATKLLSEVAKYTNPLLPVEKALGASARLAGRTAAGTSGAFTGTGGAAIKEAYASGKYDKPSFWKNLTGSGDITEVIDTAKQGVLSLKENKNRQYRSGMIDISNDKTVLSFDDIDASVNKAFNETKFKDEVTKSAAYKKVSEAQNVIDEWKNLDPSEYHTPEGMDALKQKLGDIMESVPYEQSSVRNALGGIYSSTWKTISAQAPTYGKVMKDYESASNLIRDIEKGLSLGKKVSSDTALRKLQSVMHNHAQTNFGVRSRMIKQLEQAAGKEMMPALAGQSLSEWLPRGMFGQLGRAGGLVGLATQPLTTSLIFPFTSPKISGAAAYGLGKVARLKDKILSGIPLTAEEARQAALLNYQVQNATGLLGR